MNYRTGIVTERDAATCRVRVSLLGYNMATQMLPVISQGAAADKFFSLPNVGDTVALIMDERCEDGAVIGCIYNEQDTPPSGSSADTTMVRFSDGTTITYDKASKTVTVDAVTKVIIKSPDNEVQGPLKVTGKITGQGGLEVSGGGGAQITGAVQASGLVTALHGTPGQVSLSTHVHVSAAPGSPTAPPTPGT